MSTNLFVGSLPWTINDDSLKNIFSKAGEVVSAKVIIDRNSKRSKGFGFVEMGSPDEARKAVDTLNGQEIEGRKIAVSMAKPRERD